jgi:outer membrane protein assembly factor BamB
MRFPITVPLLLAGVTSCADPLPPAASGAVVWTVSGSSAGTPAFDATKVYFLTRDHEVVALDKRNGAARWRSATGMTGEEVLGHSVLVVGNVIVTGDEDVHAFDRQSGARLWQFRPSDGYYPGLFELATDGALVFAGSPSGHVYAIRMDGTEAWRTLLKDSEEDQSAYSPVYADGLVFVCLKRFSWPRTGGIAALDATTGQVLWRVEFPAKPPNYQGGCLDQVAVAGDVVVGATEDGNIYAHDRISGQPAWSAPQLAGLEDDNGGSPEMDWRPVAGGKDVIVAGSTTSWVLGLDAATGDERWRNSIGRGAIIFPIAVAGGAAYVVGGGLELVSFDLFAGKVRWVRGRDGSSSYIARPVLDGDVIYIGGPSHMSALRR